MTSVVKNLGIGVGLRPPHYSQFLHGKPKSVSWVEVIAENFFGLNGQSDTLSFQRLEKIRKNVPVVFHGVSMSLGSVDPIQTNYLKNYKNLMDKIAPLWISDHLCWTGVEGQNLHDLLPIPYTEEALKLLVEKISKVQDYLGRKMLVENVSSYLSYKPSEMTEWEFISEVAKKADCAILLDINNIYVSSVNHQFDPITYLKSMPIDRIGQIHLAGHKNKGDFLIDTHDEPICEEVWELYEWSVKNLGVFSTMVERDDNIPEWNVLEQELLKIGDIQRKVYESNHTFQAAAAV